MVSTSVIVGTYMYVKTARDTKGYARSYTTHGKALSIIHEFPVRLIPKFPWG
jgi:hypothetical protein